VIEEINKEEINRYLTEAMGLCWHKYRPIGFGKYGCWDCGYENKDKKQRDFFSPEGFFILLNWAKGENWWYPEFEHWKLCDWENSKSYGMIKSYLINPEVFPIEVYNYLRGREK